ncbi:hypothetical protein FLM9_1451 [Candidatus Synechococcus spongiarum]|uniref:Uncharacterized protein n=1 Tax=Candidatus Synechococcus spongiarum TaxID=431041 RepID=A0A164Y674_9SYNE|nr:hypothetical protein FLM9_1451 [Candidatus Synechococcus spongiarum]
MALVTGLLSKPITTATKAGVHTEKYATAQSTCTAPSTFEQ